MSTLTGKKIGFIGGGRMGEGIFSGILKAGLIPPRIFTWPTSARIICRL